jgi:hypothetical protein
MPHHVGQAVLHRRFEVGDLALEQVDPVVGMGKRRLLLHQPLEQHQVEHPLAVPTFVGRNRHERGQETLDQRDYVSQRATMCAHREAFVTTPQPVPRLEVLRRRVEEVLDPRFGSIVAHTCTSGRGS